MRIRRGPLCRDKTFTLQSPMLDLYLLDPQDTEWYQEYGRYFINDCSTDLIEPNQRSSGAKSDKEDCFIFISEGAWRPAEPLARNSGNKDQALPQPWTSCLTLGNSLYLSGPQWPPPGVGAVGLGERHARGAATLQDSPMTKTHKWFLRGRHESRLSENSQHPEGGSTWCTGSTSTFR